MPAPSSKINVKNSLTVNSFSRVATLDDGSQTTVHVARYDHRSTRPRIVIFKRAARLAEWCQQHHVQEALVGGFFHREVGKPLGEHWLNGARHDSVSFAAPWHNLRGSVHMHDSGVAIGYRHELPVAPTGDFLQAGPLLVKDGVSQINLRGDYEGFSAAAHQFDSDITDGRYPRAAISVSKDYIWSVVCDGRSDFDSGMTLAELTAFIINLGCTEALNLDGGGSASLVTGGQLINHPRNYLNHRNPHGRPIYSAIVFESAKF